MHVAMTSAEAHLAILNIRGIGDIGGSRLIERFQYLDDFLEAPDEAFKGVVNQTVRNSLRDKDILRGAFDEALATLRMAEKAGARVLTRFDADYPRRLTLIDNSPLILYAQGDLSTLETSVACVGTRFPSHYGRVVTSRVAGMLAEEGYCIVSGLADGVDFISHRAALDHGGPTVAILGSGLDRINTSDRQQLAHEILDSGGGIFTEQPFGFSHDAGSLIRRNRLQSGSSLATFIMQCGVVSGTMHTLRYAVTQGRPVFTPIPPDDYAEEEESAGVLMLASSKGNQLHERIDIKSSLAEVLDRDFADRPVATGFRGRDDYPAVLSELRRLQVAERAPENLAPSFL